MTLVFLFVFERASSSRSLMYGNKKFQNLFTPTYIYIYIHLLRKLHWGKTVNMQTGVVLTVQKL